MNLALKAFATICSLALALNLATPTQANEATKESIVRTLSSVASLSHLPSASLLTDLAPLSVLPSGADYFSNAGASAIVSIPINSKNPIQLSGRSGTAINILLPFAAGAINSKVVADGAVAFDNKNGSISTVLNKTDGSLQVATVLEKQSAPTQFSYEVNLPKGVQMVLDSDGGVSFLTSVGRYVGGVAPAWAIDARGATVPTRYSISGSTLTQIVDHRDLPFAYPVVADPWFGIDLIDRTSWVSGTLQVYPTWWGRTTGVAARWAAWDEVVSKTPGNRENTPSMRDQLYCHFDFVRLRAPNKPSWNLDLSVPVMDYATLVLRQCN